MPPRRFVVNEWIFSDLWHENGDDKQKQTLQFLLALKDSADTLVVLEGSKWMEKAYRLAAEKNDRIIRAASKVLHREILNGAERLSQTVSLSYDVKAKFELSMQSDFYLLETYLAAKADLFITTDDKLCQRIREIEELEIRVELRDDFSDGYLKQSQPRHLARCAAFRYNTKSLTR